MLVSVLASSSSGNCTLIKTPNSTILIDLGVSTKYLTEKLAQFNIKPEEIDLILVTHGHTDHIAGLKVFTKKYNSTIYMSKETSINIDLNCPITICPKIIEYNDLIIKTIPLSHDVPTVGFVIKNDVKELVYVTDTGYLNKNLFETISNKDAYLFESNYDIEMIQNSIRNPNNVRRVLSDKGHLSNEDSAYYLVNNLIGDRTKNIVLCHLSLDHNTPQLALNTILKQIEKSNKKVDNIVIAKHKDHIKLIEI
ncbi:MAG: MBL fold metallo-hydrolase [Bacilli bacterium]